MGTNFYGPGIFDMKVGSYLSHRVDPANCLAVHSQPLPSRVPLHSGEEVERPSVRDPDRGGRPARNKYGFGAEPAAPTTCVWWKSAAGVRR